MGWVRFCRLQHLCQFFAILIQVHGLHLEWWNVLHDLSTSTEIKLRDVDNGPMEVLSALQCGDPRVNDDHGVEAARFSSPPKSRTLEEETRGDRVIRTDADAMWVVHQ